MSIVKPYSKVEEGTKKRSTTSNKICTTAESVRNAVIWYKRVGFGCTYIKIGTIQRRLAWPLRKDDTQNREAFQTF